MTADTRKRQREGLRTAPRTRDGSRLSLSATVERAQQDAAERLAACHGAAKADPAGWADAALAEALTWEQKPYRFGRHERMVEPTPRWTAMMDNLNAFTIKEVDVLT